MTILNLCWRPHSITVRAYCKCGDAIHTTISPVDDKVEFIFETFAQAHTGIFCGPCDAKTAAKARRKREKAGMER